MLEAKLNEAAILKRLLDAVKELVTDANFECNEEGINLQAMDNSHVALVAVKLDSTGFKRYRCDRPMPLGVNINSLTKVLKCAKDDDMCTLKASDDGDVLNLTYEARSADRIAEYDMKLMDIDSDQLGIPDTEYDARVTMPASEFSRIVRDLSQLGESVRIEVSKEGIRFASDGEAANGSVLLKQSEGISGSGGASGSKIKPEKDAKEESDAEEGDDDEDDEGGSKKKVKKEKVKREDGGEDGDVEMNGDGEEEEEYNNEDEEEEEDSDSKKRKKKAPAKNGKASKKAKRSLDDDPPNAVRIEMNQHVTLTFSLKYLVNFSKSSSLADKVQLMMSNDVPLLVSYEFGQGHIRYYLAPKIGDD
ncbi:proliferating cell nuclear antigen [Heliocybe sulcata]|uniref:DNA sliding clamp PCNA n=1 Tax=Heliocybe sulcata TaxID=5364 RepID=A0A5C3MMZ2_9AGAM|nr:proliferating cell nuclear antigen [Heliocybe sulcata]